MSIFLDANILFSASNTGTAIHRLLLWLNERERLVTSAYAAMEAERNIAAKRPLWSKEHKAIMTFIGIVPEAALHINIGLPNKDKPILAAAIAAKCTYLVTVDKRDFGHLYGRTIDGVMVLSIMDFANIMLAKHN